MLIYKIASHYDHWIRDKEMALQYYEKFMLTRPKDKKPLPDILGAVVVSYYDAVEKRINEIKEEMFWEGEKADPIDVK